MAGGLRTTYPGIRDKGAKYITIMIENAARSPATQKTVDDWIAKYKCEYDVVMGRINDLAPPSGGTIGLPYNVIIDTKTMIIEAVVQGDGPAIKTTIYKIIARNGG